VNLQYHHKEPCDCVNCENVRLKAWHGPGLYKAKGKGTTTWKLGVFLWDVKLAPGQLFYVVRELERGEPGWHLDAVAGVIVDGKEGRWVEGPKTCTSKKWLEPA
jgi:hypothetical protein